MNQFSRTQLLIGETGLSRLAESSVLIFGVGGVGSYTAEALARSGVGRIGVVDDDVVCITNINRQIVASLSTVGEPKVEVIKRRILDINPSCKVDSYPVFYSEKTATAINLSNYDFIIDAIDTISAKIFLIEEAKRKNLPIISSMGMGNRLDPTKIEITDISKTSHDPLSKIIRKELRKRGIYKLTVAFSKEVPLTPTMTEDLDCNLNCVCPKGSSKICTHKRQIPGSTAFVPPAAGLAIASHVADYCASTLHSNTGKTCK